MHKPNILVTATLAVFATCLGLLFLFEFLAVAGFRSIRNRLRYNGGR